MPEDDEDADAKFAENSAKKFKDSIESGEIYKEIKPKNEEEDKEEKK
jgi:hypothetical protein